MLVLTRRKGESIVVGDDIEIYVLEVSGDAVRIGIKAPKEVPVYRREIYEAILEENIAAARAAAGMSQQLKNISLLSLDHKPGHKSGHQSAHKPDYEKEKGGNGAK